MVQKKEKAKDMTSGNPFKLIFAFCIPILIGNIFQQIYNMVDSMVVGKFVGPDALAAVGLTGSISFFMFSLVIGLTNGIAVVIAQFYGAKDEAAVKRAFSTSIYTILVSGIVLSILGVIIAKPILVALRTPENILADSVRYLTIIFAGAIAMVIYNWIASILRALGDSLTPLIFLIISSVLNVILDLLFVVGFHMGVSGAAVATIIAQFFSGIICTVYALVKMKVLRLKREELICDRQMLASVVRIGIPSGVQNSFISISVMLMQSVINVYGSTVIAGFIAGTRVEQLMFQPGTSIGMANATYTGQNIGAGDYKRVKAGVRASILINVIFYSILTPFVFIFSKNLISLFVDQSEVAAQVINIGSNYLWIVSGFYVVVSILMLEQNMLRSAGDVSMTMVLGISEVVTRVAFAYLFSGIWGYIGVFWATPLTWIIAAVIGYVRYLSGKWMQKGLVARKE